MYYTRHKTRRMRFGIVDRARLNASCSYIYTPQPHATGHWLMEWVTRSTVCWDTRVQHYADSLYARIFWERILYFLILSWYIFSVRCLKVSDVRNVGNDILSMNSFYYWRHRDLAHVSFFTIICVDKGHELPWPELV